MSLFIHILCKSKESFTTNEIADFIEEGAYFDDDPEFTPPLEDADADQWDRLEIRYHPKKRPIILHRSSGEEAKPSEVTECLEELSSANKQLDPAIRDQISATEQVISVEVDPDTLPEEVWGMVDSLESFVASRCDGVVYVPGEGLYDQQLKVIHKL